MSAPRTVAFAPPATSIVVSHPRVGGSTPLAKVGGYALCPAVRIYEFARTGRSVARRAGEESHGGEHHEDTAPFHGRFSGRMCRLHGTILRARRKCPYTCGAKRVQASDLCGTAAPVASWKRTRICEPLPCRFGTVFDALPPVSRACDHEGRPPTPQLRHEQPSPFRSRSLHGCLCPHALFAG
jgi:hypothetical protein